MLRKDNLTVLLKCNACQAIGWAWHTNKLICEACGHEYKVIQNKLVMYDNDSISDIMPADSHEVPWKLAELMTDERLLGLNLGAGNSVKPSTNLINVDYLLYENSDLAVDAHDLPFIDQVFDVVASFNVFEHLSNPEQASREIYRVLKPGGRLIIHTAFLQPLHMEPYHYFNATEYGVRHWFRDFNVEKVTVSPNFSPLLNFAWIASVIQAGAKELAKSDQERIDQLTLVELASYWHDIKLGKKDLWTSDIFNLSQKLPYFTKAAVGGGFELEAIRL